MQKYRFKIMQCATGIRISLIVSLPLLGEDLEPRPRVNHIHICYAYGEGPTTSDAVSSLVDCLEMELAT